jgi:hypothetical protein
MDNFASMFGASVAHFLDEDFTMQKLLDLGREVGLSIKWGSNGERDAMIAAHDEIRRLDRLRMPKTEKPQG